MPDTRYVRVNLKVLAVAQISVSKPGVNVASEFTGIMLIA